MKPFALFPSFMIEVVEPDPLADAPLPEARVFVIVADPPQQ